MKACLGWQLSNRIPSGKSVELVGAEIVETPLIAFPRPHAGQSPSSYLQSLAFINGFQSVQELTKIVNCRPIECVIGRRSAGLLSALTSHDRSIVEGVCYTAHENAAVSDFMGVAIDSGLIEVSPQSLCPVCFAEGKHYSLFDLTLVVDCPIHGCRLLSACPNSRCGKEVFWPRASYKSFGCGHLIAEARSPRPRETAVARFLATAAEISLEGVIAWEGSPLARTLSFRARVELILFLAALKLKTSRAEVVDQIRTLRSEDRSQLLRRVESLLDDLPTKLAAEIEFSVGTTRGVTRSPGEIAMLCWEFPAELDFIERIVKAAVESANKLLRKTLLIDVNEQGANARACVLVTSEEVARMIGIKGSQVIALTEVGFFRPYTAPNKSGGRRWRYALRDIVTIIESFQAPSSYATSISGDGGISFEAAIRVWRSAGLSTLEFFRRMAGGKIGWIARSSSVCSVDGCVLSELGLLDAIGEQSERGKMLDVSAAASVLGVRPATLQLMAMFELISIKEHPAGLEQKIFLLADILEVGRRYVGLSSITTALRIPRGQALVKLTKQGVKPVVDTASGGQDIIFRRSDLQAPERHAD